MGDRTAKSNLTVVRVTETQFADDVADVIPLHAETLRQQLGSLLMWQGSGA